MKVQKRDGSLEEVTFDKISSRFRKLLGSKNTGVDVARVTSIVIASMYDGIPTSKIDEVSATTAISLLSEHPDYGTLASRLHIDNWHKQTSASVLETYTNLIGIVADDLLDIIRDNEGELQAMIDYKRDMDFDYFALSTLEKIYCLRRDAAVVERPQHMFLRVALALHGRDTKKVKETYTLMSKKKFTHASPTLFNAGTFSPQNASCFLLGTEDSLEGIFKSLNSIAQVSKLGGGIGMHIHAVRGKGSPISSTNGISDGIIPMLRVCNSVISYVNQCFTPDTVVYTKDRGPVEMASVTPADALITRDGSYKAVNEVFVRRVENEDMMRIRPELAAAAMTCTRVHEIFALRSNGIEPGFVAASTLLPGDFLAFPIPHDVPDDEDIDYAPDTMHLTRADPLALLSGAFATFGHRVEEDIIFECEDAHIIEGVRFACLRVGVLCGGSTTQLRIPRHPNLSRVAAFEPATSFAFFEADGMLFTRIADVDMVQYTGDVYDFNLQDNHNYTTACGLVHNSGRRKGSMAVYVSPDHPDLMSFLELRRPGGDENMRCRDLFLAMWIPDLFMRRVEADQDWSFLDPFTCPGLADAWGPEYDALYESYERAGKASRTLPAREVWNAIVRSQIETGTPYMLYKDACNAKSNQQNLGTIKCSNLCVAPETMVLTKDGHRRIDGLRDRSVEVWNGEEWSEVTVRQTNANAELVRVSLSNGASLECTPYHTFYLKTSEKTSASELKAGDVLLEWTPPVVALDHAPRFPNAYTHGFSCALQVPDAAPLEDRLAWLAGLLDAQQHEEQSQSFLGEVRAMLLTMGVHSEVTSGCLAIPSAGMATLRKLGLRTRRTATDSGASCEIRVEKVEYLGRHDATYCFNEPKRHMGVFNGILTGNCAEIVEYTSPDEISVCTLASLSLPAYVKGNAYDFNELHRVTKVVARNLDRVIDINKYPVPETKTSNDRHRPIGIGVQGLADVFVKLRMPFDSADAKALNARIFATMYHAALEASAELAAEHGPYPSYEGSPASRGTLQFDLWGVTEPEPSLDWNALRNKIKRHGLRNSLSIAVMPTASTAQILGNNESIEPFTSLLYTRRTLAGEFTVLNRHLVDDLLELGLWTETVKNQIIANGGSVQRIAAIPQDLKELYKTAWDMSQKAIIDQASDRGPYVCQSQSMNLFVAEPTLSKMTSAHFYAWRRGLKTGQYYLRSKPGAHAKKITLTQPREDPADCVMCSA